MIGHHLVRSVLKAYTDHRVEDARTSRRWLFLGTNRIREKFCLADQKTLSKSLKTANKQSKRPPRGGRFVCVRELQVPGHLIKT